jgi:peptide/nickel transport system ATP-binding protein/oligopeptide transport system ATP-binding protein
MMQVLEVTDLKKSFTLSKGAFAGKFSEVRAVDGVSLSIGQGETLALVGESGCGKSTVGKLIMRLLDSSGGALKLNGTDITHLSPQQMRPLRKQIQIVFQDPYASLNPRMTAGDIVGESLIIHGVLRGEALRERVASLLSLVGLPEDAAGKYPHEFSGGQRQRIGIAKAIALNPSLVVCDEAVSALDVSVQAQILNLLFDLQQELGLSYLFISHDLAVVEHISHRVAVMYLGRIVETAPTKALFAEPLHPYTEALLSATPELDPDADRSRRIVLTGDVPSPIAPPPGCHFHTRCRYAMPECKVVSPPLRELAPGHWAACHLHDGGVVSPLRVREAVV